ncbi:MAG: hypothetical protein FWC68_05120 [Oscillospiraceae bacterium]|nr:hypothetical protein [Oscillospiraceae bacterium]
MKEFIKEIIIMLLFVIVIILLLGILLYEYIPSAARSIPATVVAEPLPRDVQEDIAARDRDNEEHKRIFSTADDLRPVEANVNRGKQNPFAPYVRETPPSEEGGNNTTGNNTNNTNTTGNNTANNNNTTTNNNTSGNNTGGNTTGGNSASNNGVPK